MTKGSTIIPVLAKRSTGEFQPFGIAVVELVGIGKQLLDARPIGFAIPGDAHRHAGPALFRLRSFHLILVISDTMFAK
jgi:hypothetical protein